MRPTQSTDEVITAAQAHPRRIVQDLLERPPEGGLQPASRPLLTRRMAALERQAPQVLDAARAAGVEVEYLGTNSLFSKPRLYRGAETDWVLGPAGEDQDAVVPRKERQVLQKLADAKIEFPLIYIAHEVAHAQSEQIADSASATVLDPAQAAELVGPVPPPAASVALGERLAQRSQQVVHAVGRTLPIVGAATLGVIAAPVVLVGGALASLATLDPVILGAIPALSAQPGQPAAWYVLARWDW